jgi:hypothetical protein
MVGLSLGSFLAFAVGRWLGTAFVQRLVSPAVWHRLGFVVEAEGVIVCFILYLIPGFPKDMLCYLFGLSPMPFWAFALTSTAGRLPGTWVLSAQGADTAAGHYLEIALLMALVAAVALPLYHYRHRLLDRLHRPSRLGPGRPGDEPAGSADARADQRAHGAISPGPSAARAGAVSGPEDSRPSGIYPSGWRT